MRRRHRQRSTALVCVLATALVAAPAARAAHTSEPAAVPVSPGASAAALHQLTGLSPSQVAAKSACPPATATTATCFARIVVHAGTNTPVHPQAHAGARPAATEPRTKPATEPSAQAAPSYGTAAYLQSAYDLTWLSANKGGTDTVAIVDAYDDPSAESDLGTFRSTNGLSACTTADGCFSKVNQDGQASPLPDNDPQWEVEESLDLDAVSSLCPNCRIILVEADSAYLSDLHAAVQTAHNLGANQISMSFGAPIGGPLGGTWSFPGAASLAAAGDYGYQGDGNDTQPGSLPDVTAVGGSSLTNPNHDTRGFDESAWSLDTSTGDGTGSGCNLYEQKPTWQADTGCPGRAWNDFSADADPDTGLEVYDAGNGGWILVGGTSLATPLSAAFEAVTAVDGTTPEWSYSDRRLLNDIVSGSSGTCTTEPSYICNAGPGYDGPTGNGSISGDVAAGGPGIGGSYAAASEPGVVELAGGVYPNGVDTSYYWEYGPTTAYGQHTTPQDIGTGPALAGVQDIVGNLTPGTSYHFRLVAENADGTAYGYDYTFHTSSGAEHDPLNTTLPTISGTPQTGQTLTATPGSWSASTGVSYQWQEAPGASGPFTGIPGASASQYTLTDASTGEYVRVLVTDDTASAGLTSATSNPLGPVDVVPPANTSAPTIAGIAKQGRTLTAGLGTWSPSGTVTYAWQRSTDDGSTWQNIPSAAASTYTLAAADVGAQVRVLVTETDSAGSTPAASQPLGPVAAPAPPVSITAPSIGGAPAAGQTLTASPGTWNPSGGFSYEWLACTSPTDLSTCLQQGLGTPQGNGSTDTFLIFPYAYQGDYFRVTVIATNADGQATVTSPAVGPVTEQLTLVPITPPLPTPPGADVTPPSITAAPRLTGRPRLGSRISLTGGSYRGASSERAQFYRCSAGCRPVGRAGQNTYTLTSADQGAYIRAQVHASGAGGTTTAWASGMVGPVSSPNAGGAPVRPGQPTTVRAGSVSLARVRTTAAGGHSSAVKITFSPAGRPRGSVTVRACVSRRGDLVSCTPARVMRSTVSFTVTLTAGEQLQVVAIRRG